jgi:hypothetical protein
VLSPFHALGPCTQSKRWLKRRNISGPRKGHGIHSMDASPLTGDALLWRSIHRVAFLRSWSHRVFQEVGYGRLCRAEDEGEIVNASGFLIIPWPPRTDGLPLELDALLATATDPTIVDGQYPSVQEIASAWKQSTGGPTLSTSGEIESAALRRFRIMKSRNISMKADLHDRMGAKAPFCCTPWPHRARVQDGLVATSVLVRLRNLAV